MERLKAIVKYINNTDVVADVGCDHGYLLKMAINNKDINKGYAIDNKIGPLNSAKKNLSSYSNIEFILSDGLTGVDKSDINCVVIAGMGGTLINKIINESIEKFKNINKIILCPNRNIDKVRLYLNSIDYKIVDEDIICEDDKYYEILVYEKGKQILNKKDIIFGPVLLRKRKNEFINKWNDYYLRIKNIQSKNDEIEIIEEVLNEN